MNESLESDEDALETLVGQLEEEPEGSWVALQGLGAVEPEVRAEIIGGLAKFPTGPGLVNFLRLLTFAHDPTTRAAALDALAGRAELDDEHRSPGPRSPTTIPTPTSAIGPCTCSAPTPITSSPRPSIVPSVPGLG